MWLWQTRKEKQVYWQVEWYSEELFAIWCGVLSEVTGQFSILNFE